MGVEIMEAIIGFVLGVATAMLLREMARKDEEKPPKPYRDVPKEEHLATETRNFLNYDGTMQKEDNHG
jgi:hypothetical protein